MEASPEPGSETEATPEPSPLPSPHKSKVEVRPDDGARLEVTITLDIDPTTGLIAVELVQSCVLKLSSWEPSQEVLRDRNTTRQKQTSRVPRDRGL